MGLTIGSYNNNLNYADWHFEYIAPIEFTLPSDLKIIQTEAFANIKAEKIIIPETVETIESLAFANCGNLQVLYFVGSPIDIASDIISECENVTVSVVQGSTAETWANSLNLNVEYH